MAVYQRAARAFHKALKAGLLVRQACEVCGGEPSHGHHDDYSRPLEVRWLCRSHHRQHHIAEHRAKQAALQARVF